MDFRFDPEGHIYTLDGVRLPNITGVLAAEGFIDKRWFTPEACDRGRIVHKATHLLDMGDLDPESIDPAIEGYLEGWERFKQAMRFTLIESEVPRFHSLYMFAGTPDRVYAEAIVEIKTGTLSPWTALQTGAQAELVTPKGERPRPRFGVNLDGKGGFKLHPFEDRDDGRAFLSILAGHNWKKNNGGLFHNG